MVLKRIGMVVVAGVLVAGALASAQEGPPSGKVSVQSKSIAVGVGVSWGDGTLTYQGKQHKFSIGGLSVIDLGVSKASAAGDVFNLKKLEDFNGNYAAAQAGAAAGAGAGAIVMRNQNGVVLKLTGMGQGVKLALGPSGVDVKLK